MVFEERATQGAGLFTIQEMGDKYFIKNNEKENNDTLSSGSSTRQVHCVVFLNKSASLHLTCRGYMYTV